MLTSGMDDVQKQEYNTLLISWCSLHKIDFKMNLPKVINFYLDWCSIIQAKFKNKKNVS